MSSEFQELLIRAGHRPAKVGRRWFCASCPSGKAPALAVGQDVFFCHRCGQGGNIGTLRRDLGITGDQRWTKDQKRNYAKKKDLARAFAADFLVAFRLLRLQKVIQFRAAYGIELLCRDIARRCLAQGRPVPYDIVDLAYLSGLEKDVLESDLQFIDDPANLASFVQTWRKNRAA